MNMVRIIPSILVAILATLMSACGTSGGQRPTGDNIIRHADNLRISDGDGYSHVVIRNPWDTTKTLASYFLVQEGAELPPEAGSGSEKIIKIPLKNSLVYSNVHVSLMHELGVLDAVGGVCDAEYITDSLASSRIAEKVIRDCGQSMQPNMEAVMQMRPDGILAAPMENNPNHGKLAKLGIPLIQAADYLESSPLGRAEWMRFYGRLYGRGTQADSMFRAVEREYNDIANKVATSAHRPKVLIDGVYGQSWNLPTRKTATGILIHDAGGLNPFDEYDKAGSISLSPEEVLYKGADADVWFIRYFNTRPMTLSMWNAENKNYARFKAFKEGNVFGANTMTSGIFDDGAFHPQWVLADMASILHPEIKNISHPKYYYHKLQ